MNKFLTVLGHTYFSKLKSKAFIITTVIFLVIIAGLANIDRIIDLFINDEADKVAVIDNTEGTYAFLESTLEQQDETIELTAYKSTEEEGKQDIEHENYDGLLVINSNDNNMIEAVFYQNEASSSLQHTIENQLQQVKIAMATEKAGIDSEALAEIYAEMPFEHIALNKAAKTEEELNSARGIVYVMLFLLYMTVLMYGQMIATEVATEKSSRVMEILISSASPITHMFAKIIGVGLLGLTQIAVFLIAGYAFIANRMNELSGEFFEGFGFSSTSASVYFYAVLFFVLGYFLYATISTMLGSLVSRVEDVQQLIMPVIFLVMIAFFIAMFGLGVPEATFITVTSFIPFFSPMIMFLRVGMLDVPIWQVALSIALLLGTIYIFAVIGARIYRGGVLMYGGSRSLKDIKNALQLSKRNRMNQ